jgi:phosphoribosylformylglycinamidine synthase subunit PurS
MKFVADIDIMPHPELLDPQGKIVSKNLAKLDLGAISDVRIGKHIALHLDAADAAAAAALADTACRKLLANQIMEGFVIKISQA